MPYYYLKEGEIIQQGDEFKMTHGWVKFISDIGKPAYEIHQYTPRRLIKHSMTQENLHHGIRMLMVLADELSSDEDIIFAYQELENLL